MDFDGKVIAVTGGGSGIGRAVVLELLRRGSRVAAIDLRPESLEETATEAAAEDRLLTIPADVTDRARVESLVDQITSTLGAVDALIHCAGIIQPFVVLKDLGYDDMERVVNVNLWGTVHVVKAFLPHLLKRPEAHIALVSSMGGFLPVPGQTIYGATKAGVKLMGEGLYAELLETNVGVSVVLPGAVGTNITANSGVDIPVTDAEASTRRVTSADDAANVILDGIERDRLHIYVGRDSRVMSVLTKVAPRRATHLIYRQMKDLLGK